MNADRIQTLEAIQKRVLWLACWMVHHANNVRPNDDAQVVRERLKVYERDTKPVLDYYRVPLAARPVERLTPANDTFLLGEKICCNCLFTADRSESVLSTVCT